MRQEQSECVFCACLITLAILCKLEKIRTLNANEKEQVKDEKWHISF